MEKDVEREENITPESSLPQQMPKIEETENEGKVLLESPAFCGECREYLAKMSASVSGSNRPLSPAGWIGVNLLMAIPLVNVLFLFLWACGGTDRVNLKNYSRGVLLTVVLLVLAFLVTVVILDSMGMRLVIPDNIKELLL